MFSNTAIALCISVFTCVGLLVFMVYVVVQHHNTQQLQKCRTDYLVSKGDVMLHWFGSKPWARFCDPIQEIPVPTGKVCVWCDEAIEPDQNGGAVPELRDDGSAGFALFHCECLVRSLLGSAGHLRNECGCYNRQDISEVGLTQREAAVQTWRFFQAQLRAERAKVN